MVWRVLIHLEGFSGVTLYDVILPDGARASTGEETAHRTGSCWFPLASRFAVGGEAEPEGVQDGSGENGPGIQKCTFKDNFHPHEKSAQGADFFAS